MELKGVFGESYRRRGGYELTALLAHNLVFRKHLRECVWYQASIGVFKSGLASSIDQPDPARSITTHSL